MPPTATAKPKPMPVFGAALSVEAAPGERVVFLDQLPDDRRFGVFEWQKLGDGTFAPVVRIYDAEVRIDVVRKKIVDIGYDTIRRLIIAGFVEGSQPSPGVILVAVNSLLAHLRATREPDFWTPERIRKYRSALR